MSEARKLLKQAHSALYFECGQCGMIPNFELREAIKSYLAKPDQDPVAYAVYGIGSKEKGKQHHLHAVKIWKGDGDDMIDDCGLGDYWSGNEKLYAEPTKRKPLAESEIAKHFYGPIPNLGTAIAFARSIERAHGITEV